MKQKLVIIVLVAASIILLYFTFFDKKEIGQVNQYEKLKVIPVRLNSQSLYIKIAVWGVSADKESIIVSKDSSQFVDISKDLIFEGVRSENFFYVKQDILHLVFDIMKQKNTIKDFDHLIKVEDIENTGIYDLYNKRLMLEDSIRIVKL